MLFFATTINYLDRQVLSLTWDEFIKPEFHWDESHYGAITAVFSFVYAACMLFAGRLIDWLGSKRGYLWAIGIWSSGACMHALCGVITEHAVGLHNAAQLAQATGDVVVVIATVSNVLLPCCQMHPCHRRSGQLPGRHQGHRRVFPQERPRVCHLHLQCRGIDRRTGRPPYHPAACQSLRLGDGVFIIGALGFHLDGVLGIHVQRTVPKQARQCRRTGYIEQDYQCDKQGQPQEDTAKERPMNFIQCFRYRQTWAFAIGKFMTDGVWWFFLFWIPAYLNTQFGIKTSEGLGMALIFTLYAITMLSIYGGKLPTLIINRTGLNPYAARMRAMLIFAFFPLLVLLAQPLGTLSPWFPGYPDRYRGSSPPVLVGQHFLYGRRHVPQIRHRYRNRHRPAWQAA